MTTIEKKTFDPLYGMSKDGKIKNWEICVERFDEYSEIVTLHGYENKIETRVRVNKGKNALCFVFQCYGLYFDSLFLN